MNTKFAVLVCLFVAGVNVRSFGQSGIQAGDTTAVPAGTYFSLHTLVCALEADNRLIISFTVPETLYVSMTILDSLKDTVYASETKRLAPGNYKATWLYKDRTIEKLPPFLWFELRATLGSSWKSLRFLAVHPFCVIEHKR